jgi:hypothetical protein
VETINTHCKMMRTLLLLILTMTGTFGFTAPMTMARSTALHGSKASTLEGCASSSARAHWENVKWCSRSKLWVTADAAAPVPSPTAEAPTAVFDMWSNVKYDSTKQLWVNAATISSAAATKKPAANSRAGRATALMTLVLSGVDIMQGLPDHLSSSL